MNPLDGEASEEEQEFDEHKQTMEEGGFTIVAPEQEGSTKAKGSDGITTVQGVT